MHANSLSVAFVRVKNETDGYHFSHRDTRSPKVVKQNGIEAQKRDLLKQNDFDINLCGKMNVLVVVLKSVFTMSISFAKRKNGLFQDTRQYSKIQCGKWATTHTHRYTQNVRSELG